MDRRWGCELLRVRDNRFPAIQPLDRRNPSTFSSTLLDAVYRSIDQIDGGAGEDMAGYGDLKKQSSSGFEHHDEDMARLRRACLIEKWMEKKATQIQNEKAVIRRRSVPDFERNPWRLTHSSSSSSDSSSGGGFSSSEAESIYGGVPMKPKPVRTTASTTAMRTSLTEERRKQRKPNNTHDQNQDKKSTPTIKKPKKPISPGGRLAGFLNSLFSAKSKSDEVTATATATHSKSCQASSCSSASSFSRSCLSTGSKTSKRSVRFNFDDNHQPYSQQESSTIRIPLSLPKASIKTQVKLQTIENLYQKMTQKDMESDIEDDDDAASYASSDLFELDNLSSIGIDRYCQDLPVYETTHVDTNRAIANGLIP